MKIVLISDLHLMFDDPIGRIDNVHEAQKKKMQFIIDYETSNDAVILQAGDFFHAPRSWHLAEEWIRFFKENDFREMPIPIYAVFGQHDMYMHSQDTRRFTSLGILNAAGCVTILRSEPYILNPFASKGPPRVNLYGCSWGEDVPAVTTDTTGLNILVIHKQIVPHKLWSAQEEFDYAPTFLKTHKDFDLILAGDCHRRYEFGVKGGRIICSTGCITRYQADKYNLEEYAPGMYVYDTEDKSIEWVEIPHEPSSKVLSRSHIEQKEKVDAMLDEFIEAIESTTEGLTNEEVGTFADNLVKYCRRYKIKKSVLKVLSEAMDEEVKF